MGGTSVSCRCGAILGKLLVLSAILLLSKIGAVALSSHAVGRIKWSSSSGYWGDGTLKRWERSCQTVGVHCAYSFLRESKPDLPPPYAHGAPGALCTGQSAPAGFLFAFQELGTLALGFACEMSSHVSSPLTQE